MALAADFRTPAHRARRADAMQYRLIFAAAFVVMLAAAVVERLAPWRLMQASRASTDKSVFAEAKTAADTCATYALMG